MARDDADHEHEFGLVMPFTPVVSKGGPYDDNAYVAGYEAGRLDARLDHERPGVTDWMPVHVPNVEQLDLIAMRRGYLMEQHGTDEFGEWAQVRFMRLDLAEGVTT